MLIEIDYSDFHVVVGIDDFALVDRVFDQMLVVVYYHVVADDYFVALIWHLHFFVFDFSLLLLG